MKQMSGLNSTDKGLNIDLCMCGDITDIAGTTKTEFS